ncbi:MAG: glycosyltransferase family 2 protein [Anaerolineae bacterium]|nr:glycosyltransferase family 2 protein [Anaerolineae bacterium]
MSETLTAVILTRNEARHIADCIASVAFADTVVVFDSGSTDDTVAIAMRGGAHVLHRDFDDYAGQRNAALDAVGQGWVLFVDADERVTPELAAEVRQAIAQGAPVGYQIPRHNYIFGKLTRGAGWYPDYQTRLLKVGAARYDPAKKVHEVVLLDGPQGTLEQPIVHYNYDHPAQFHAKQRRYVAYDARILFEQGVRPKLYTPFTQAVRHFRWRYLMLGGWRDSWHGLRLSALMAWYEYRKYRLLQGLWRQGSKTK